MSCIDIDFHCTVPLFWVRDFVTRSDERNRGKLQASKYTAANFTMLMEHSIFHAYTATEEKLDIVTCKFIARERLGEQQIHNQK
jgi:hypothetical protein